MANTATSRRSQKTSLQLDIGVVALASFECRLGEPTFQTAAQGIGALRSLPRSIFRRSELQLQKLEVCSLQQQLDQSQPDLPTLEEEADTVLEITLGQEADTVTW